MDFLARQGRLRKDFGLTENLIYVVKAFEVTVSKSSLPTAGRAVGFLH